MIEKLSDENLDFLETFYYSPAIAEVLFSDYDNLTIMQDEKLAHLRMGQIPLISHEHMVDEDPALSEKENFQLRKNTADVFALGGRLFGKTLFVEKIDFLISVPLLGAEKCGFSSYDAIHIRGVLEDVILSLEHHPFFRIYKPEISRSPSYRIAFKTGYVLEGINMNITGKKPGAQFFQKHMTRLYIEEASFETEQVYQQRRDSVSENGCVYRIAGMTNFTKYSPCGKVFYDLSQKNKIVNLPQYVNPKWDTRTKKQAIKDFGGEQSIGYRIFIKGEVVEEGVCIVEGSKILKSDFYQVPIEDINVGDELLAFTEGCPRTLCKSKVIAKLDNGVREVVGIKSGNNKLWLTPTHKVVAFNRKGYSWVDIETCLKRNYPILSLNHVIQNEYLYYWGCLLGIIESDGTKIYDSKQSDKYSIYITQSLSCEWKSIEWLLKTLAVEYSRYEVKSSNNHSFLYRYCLKRKFNSNIEHISNQLKKNQDIALGYISGFIIGDGWVDKKQKLFKICQSKKKNLNKCLLLEELFKIYDIKYFSYENKDTGMIEYGFSRLEILPLLQFSYKVSKFRELICGSHLWKLAKPIKEIGRAHKKVYDLITESHTFIAEGFCVHNSVFDMERVRIYYNEEHIIKDFEISKENFTYFTSLLGSLESPRNSSGCYIFADVGESAPTKIGIIFKIGTKYKYIYKITTYNLTDKEQFKLFRWLGEKLNATYIALDTTDGTGRAIYRSLAEVFPEENLIWCAFNEKLPIDFEKDDKGNIIFKEGKPVYKEEYVSEWSIKHLKDILYSGLIDLPIDYELDQQLNSVVSMQSGVRTVYTCVSQENHLFQSFQVFSICHWLCEFLLLKPVTKTGFCKTGV